MLLRFEDAVYKKHLLNLYLKSGKISVYPGCNLKFGVFLSGDAKWKINVEEIIKLIIE